ncbi:unnamed protein product [marine sediment metagenome]|uniref:Uncharacterized protein n=1 Tax=marine sediment metagenome TaxID=412755 RepID=X0ZKG0_9ZZZZ
MTGHNKAEDLSTKAKSLFESCLYPFQGTVLYHGTAFQEPRAALDLCFAPYAGLLCGALKTAV